MVGDRAVGFVFQVSDEHELLAIAGTRHSYNPGDSSPVPISALPISVRTRVFSDEYVVIQRSEHEAFWRHLRLQAHLDSVILTPVKVGNETCAVLGMAMTSSEADEARSILTTLGSQVSLALERVSLSEQLHIRQSEERFHSLVENASDLILILTREGSISWASPSVNRILGMNESEYLDQTFIHLVHSADQHNAVSVLESVTAHPGTIKTTDLRIQAGRNDWRSMEVTFNNLLEDASLMGIVANARDVTERKSAEAKLAQLAYFDPLTDLPNRARFTAMLNEDIKRFNAGQLNAAVLFIDLDRFKLVNDSLGHEAGDTLLREAGKRISSQIRPGDTVARLGGDEFTVLISGFEHADEPLKIAQAILGAFADPLVIGDREVFVDASIGIAVVTKDVPESGELLRRADIAMYRAKETGGQSIATFDKEMGEHLLLRLDLETELRHAIEREELEIYFQPEIDLKTNRLHAAEALLRWKHPRLGMVPPGEFIPLAEETGLILEIGRWVMQTALEHASSWYAIFPDLNMTISVNLSVRQYLHLGIVDEVAELLRQTSVPTERLRLEITETILMDEKTASRSVVERLDDLGIQLAVDDFGSGYSNLGYLKRLPIEALKIDQIFIRGLGTDQHDQAIVRAITELSHEIGLRVTAEGVETEEQLKIIREIGCDAAQGFLFAHPLPADEFLELLRRDAALTQPALEFTSSH
jgi:diguanylate cyclase (GGDEF)-like protein/PAS domain S-box-containing protein